MDDELEQLEAELKHLRPLAPPPRLAARIECDLAPRFAPRAATSAWWRWGLALPIAAAIALASIGFFRGEMAPPHRKETSPVGLAAQTLKPVAAKNVLYDAKDEGLVTLHDGTPARRERLNYLDTITWRNPKTNASLTWTMAREEIRVVPVIYQ